MRIGKKGEICWNFTQVYRAKHEEKRDAAFVKYSGFWVNQVRGTKKEGKPV